MRLQVLPALQSVAILYSKEKANIDRYCSEKKLDFTVKDNVAYVISKHDFWRIMLDDTTGTLTLYHRSTAIRKNKKDSSDVPMYHRQESRSTTINGHLRCIANHDAYRDKLLAEAQKPKKKNPSDRLPSRSSKKGRKLAKQQKNREKSMSVSRVLALIEELEATEN